MLGTSVRLYESGVKAAVVDGARDLYRALGNAMHGCNAIVSRFFGAYGHTTRQLRRTLG